MKKAVKILSPVLVLFISIFIVQALIAAKPAPEKKDPEPRLVSLFVDEVQSDTVKLSVSSQGEVKAKTSIDLISQVSGRILSISDHFAEGAEFDSEDVLINIDSTDYDVAVVRAESKVAEAKVGLERERANALIKESDWKKKNSTVKPTAFSLNKPQVAEAEAKLRAAKADLAEARLNVKRASIKLPFKGRVMEKSVGIGQYITAGTKLGHVFATDTVEIRMPLTDSQLVELELPMGFTADENHQAPEVVFSATVGNKMHTWKGHIVRTNAAIDQQTRLIYAIAEIKDPYGAGSDEGTAMAVGMFVTAEIEGVHSQQAYRLPRQALRKADQVYVVNDDNRIEIRTVEILSTNSETLLLSSGVEVGEKVVTSTLPSAHDGMEVKTMSRNEITQL